MSKSAFFFLLKLRFFFLTQKGAFFSCVFFFAQTCWEDCCYQLVTVTDREFVGFCTSQ